MKSLFKQAYDHGPYDQGWIRRVEKRRYHFIRIRDLAEWAGEDYVAQAGGQFLCDLTEIDLDEVPRAELREAFNDEDDLKLYRSMKTQQEKDEVQVEVSVNYGSGTDLSSRAGGSPKALRKVASRISHEDD